jgi:transcriptional regulator GlxA family with amidase domain
MYREIRLERARGLLKHSSLSVTEIASRSGYRSLRRFNDDFRARFGQSPRAILKGTRS